LKRVLFRPAAVKDFEALQKRDRDLVAETIERFARTGQGDVKKLKGKQGENAFAGRGLAHPVSL
jgi:hypothetical protein